MDFQLSDEQQNAISKLQAWYEDEEMRKRPFIIDGYAGTGKTTLIRHAVGESSLNIESETLFGAYTGKAALVMSRTGVNARTIHSLIYKPLLPNKILVEELREQIKKELDEEKKKELQAQLKDEDKLKFVLSNDSPLAQSKLLVLDECSMVNEEILKDLLSFRCPIVALGDPGQLPPIEGKGALFKHGANAQLIQIHRQAKGNPIIGMSYRARNSIPIPFELEGRARHIKKLQVKNEELLNCDQIIAGKNATRMKMNSYIRKLKDFTDPYPVVGDKLICLRNNYKVGLFNGLIAEVVEVGELYDDYLILGMTSDDFPKGTKTQHIEVLRCHFDAYYDKDAVKNLSWWDRKKAEEFDFGYAITVHKAQGSQWDNIIMLDDKMLAWKRKERAQWLYTGITRAAETLTVVDMYG